MVYPNPKQKVIQGADFNFFEQRTVTDAAFVAANAYQPGVRGTAFSFYLRVTSGDPLEYSFNGITVHGVLTAAQAERFFPNRSVSKMWFRTSGSSNIEVEGWANA